MISDVRILVFVLSRRKKVGTHRTDLFSSFPKEKRGGNPHAIQNKVHGRWPFLRENLTCEFAENGHLLGRRAKRISCEILSIKLSSHIVRTFNACQKTLYFYKAEVRSTLQDEFPTDKSSSGRDGTNNGGRRAGKIQKWELFEVQKLRRDARPRPGVVGTICHGNPARGLWQLQEATPGPGATDTTGFVHGTSPSCLVFSRSGHAGLVCGCFLRALPRLRGLTGTPGALCERPRDSGGLHKRPTFQTVTRHSSNICALPSVAKPISQKVIKDYFSVLKKTFFVNNHASRGFISD